jgi:hypothetical protein
MWIRVIALLKVSMQKSKNILWEGTEENLTPKNGTPILSLLCLER